MLKLLGEGELTERLVDMQGQLKTRMTKRLTTGRKMKYKERKEWIKD